MKNKKVMYALLAASVLIWGWVFVKLFNVLFKEDEPALAQRKANSATHYVEEADSFVLLAHYRDPFLRHVRGSASVYGASPAPRSLRPVKKPVVQEKKKEEKVIDWSFIRYKGKITRKTNGKILSLMNIGGGDFALEEGGEAQQVQLLKIYPDSILVKFDGVKKYIKRNQN